MGLGYTLFVKPFLVLLTVSTALVGLYLLPEYWPDHASARDAIRRNDTASLQRYLARGLSPDERAQWRSYPRRALGRATSAGVGGSSTPALAPASRSLLEEALTQCDALEAARVLVDAGADVAARDAGGWSLLGRAAGCADEALVTAMLTRGADPNADEPDGGTVLWEPTTTGWRQRPFDEAIVAAMVARQAARPSRAPARR